MDFISVCPDHVSAFCLAHDLPVLRSGFVRTRRAIDWFMAFRFDGLVRSRTRNHETAPGLLVDSAICVTRHHQRGLHVATALGIHIRDMAVVHDPFCGNYRQHFDTSERADVDALSFDSDDCAVASDFWSVLHTLT